MGGSRFPFLSHSILAFHFFSLPREIMTVPPSFSFLPFPAVTKRGESFFTSSKSPSLSGYDDGRKTCGGLSPRSPLYLRSSATPSKFSRLSALVVVQKWRRECKVSSPSSPGVSLSFSPLGATDRPPKQEWVRKEGGRRCAQQVSR